MSSTAKERERVGCLEVTSNFTQRWIARIHEGWAQICQHQTWKKKSACVLPSLAWASERARAGHGRQSHDLVLLGAGKGCSLFRDLLQFKSFRKWKALSHSLSFFFCNVFPHPFRFSDSLSNDDRANYDLPCLTQFFCWEKYFRMNDFSGGFCHPLLGFFS